MLYNLQMNGGEVHRAIDFLSKDENADGVWLF
jgi:hypothetical protein